MILDEAAAGWDEVCLVHGGATGIDEIAVEYAREKGWEIVAFWPEWNRRKKAAGPERNRRMAKESGARLLLAFPWTERCDGTLSCIREFLSVRKADVRIYWIE